jgi:trk system potassium uptake protein TrkH
MLGYIGSITLLVSIFLLLPLLVLPIYKTEIQYMTCFVIPALPAGILGVFLRRNLKHQSEKYLSIEEAGVIVVVSWFVAIIFSAIPFMLSNQLNLTQALFESVSGWTTTGLSVVDVTKTPKIFLLWRSTMQFFGGAGFAVIMLSAIIGPSGTGLYNAEGRADRLLPNVTKSTKLIMSIYSAYTIAGILLYILAGMPWFDAIIHSFSALSTGGFSTQSSSIGAYNNLSIELITILGTTNFAAHYLLLKGNVKLFFRIGEVKIMLFLIAFFVPLVSFLSLNGLYQSLGRSIRIGTFEVVSALSTTGYSVVSYSNWNSFPIFCVILLMLIGGGTGSTAGGIKLYRIYILYKSLTWNIQQFFLPKNIVREKFVYRPEGKYFIKDKHILEISNFFFAYLMVYAVGVMVFLINGYSLQDSMFEFASSFGTVGLSIGITSASTAVPVLLMQMVGMILGRLEIFVVFYAVIKIVNDLRQFADSKSQRLNKRTKL